MLTFNRTAQDKSFFYYDKEAFDYEGMSQAQIDILKSHLKSSSGDAIEQILKSSNFVDSESTLNYTLIAELLGLDMISFNKRVRDLRTAGLLVSVPFQFADGSNIRRVKCDVLGVEAVAKYLEKGPVDTQTKSPVVHRWDRKKKLSSLGLMEPKKVTSESRPPIVKPAGSGHTIMDQLVTQEPRDRKLDRRKKKIWDQDVRDFYVTVNEGETKKLTAEIKSYSGIMDAEDYQVLLAIYSLIYSYHHSINQSNSELGSDYKYNNLSPVYIDHIITLLGRAICGSNKSYVRNSIQAIEHTEFTFMGLDSLILNHDNTVLHGYTSQTFKNFQSCDPFTQTEHKVIVDEDGNKSVVFGDDATLYFISLPPFIFDSLIKGEKVLAFPDELLQLHPLLFSLYLRFRAFVGKDKRHSENLKSIHKKINSKASFFYFKEMLLNEFTKIAKEEPKRSSLTADVTEDKETIRFNLFGYHGVISLRESSIFVYCDHDEMLDCCRVERRLGNKNDAPVLFNSLSATFADEVKKQVNKKLVKFMTTKRFKFNLYCFPTDGSLERDGIEFHRYMSNEDYQFNLERLCDTLDKKVKLNMLDEKVLTELERLDFLEVDGHVVTPDEMLALLKYCNLDGLNINLVDFIQKINRKNSTHADLAKLIQSDFSYIDPVVLKVLDDIYASL